MLAIDILLIICYDSVKKFRKYILEIKNILLIQINDYITNNYIRDTQMIVH
jgi:hypothetical protein